MIILYQMKKKKAARLLQRTLTSANCLGLDKFPRESNSFLVPTGDSNQRGTAPCPSPHSTQPSRRGPKSPSSQVSLGTSRGRPGPRKAEGCGEEEKGEIAQRGIRDRRRRRGRERGRRVCKVTGRGGVGRGAPGMRGCGVSRKGREGDGKQKEGREVQCGRVTEGAALRQVKVRREAERTGAGRGCKEAAGGGARRGRASGSAARSGACAPLPSRRAAAAFPAPASLRSKWVLSLGAEVGSRGRAPRLRGALELRRGPRSAAAATSRPRSRCKRQL